jgi:hypothetical protein
MIGLPQSGLAATGVFAAICGNPIDLGASEVVDLGFGLSHRPPFARLTDLSGFLHGFSVIVTGGR